VQGAQALGRLAPRQAPAQATQHVGAGGHAQAGQAGVRRGEDLEAGEPPVEALLRAQVVDGHHE
jgi:hypothetical protein